jgi:hypothetical protein
MRMDADGPAFEARSLDNVDAHETLSITILQKGELTQ